MTLPDIDASVRVRLRFLPGNNRANGDLFEHCARSLKEAEIDWRAGTENRRMTSLAYVVESMQDTGIGPFTNLSVAIAKGQPAGHL